VRSTLPYDPRRQFSTDRSWVAGVGHFTIAGLTSASDLLQTLVSALASVRTPGQAARVAVRQIALTQILFTGVDALSLVSIIGLLIGATIIIQTSLLAPGAGGEVLGRILVAIVIRELAPLVTAIIVAGRSGTAIATELGNMKVNDEVHALASLGIDPPRYIVWPRLVASMVSVLVLTVYFSAVAVGGGYVVSLLIASPSLQSLRVGFAAALVPADLGLFVVKGLGLGLIVGWLSCHFGLRVQSSPTEVPQQASRAVVMALLGCVVLNTLVTATFYWLVGPAAAPIQQPSF
jgi:phospholipid/cholesterol/gamma-HCH transport system permease protein